MSNIDYSSLSDMDLSMYKFQKQRIQFAFDELCNLVNYPPFRIFKNGLANPYIDELRETHDSERSRKLDDYLDEQFKPFEEFIKKNNSDISVARKYLSRSDNDPKLAMEMYAAENPEHELTDEELYAPSRTI